PLQALQWDYERAEPEPDSRIVDEPDVELVLKEINGYYVYPRDRQEKEEKGHVYTLHDALHVPSFTALKDDGSTACGSWIYRRVYPEPGRNLAAARETGQYPHLDLGFAWPANRRILYNRASADPQGQPWSERKKYIWWDAQRQQWTGYDIPDFPVNKAPDY